LKLRAKAKLITETDIDTIKAKTGTERDVSTRAARGDVEGAEFEVRSKIKVVTSVRAEIGKASIEVVVEVGVRAEIRKESIEAVTEVSIRAISIFSTDCIAKARGTRGSCDTKSRIEFKVRIRIVETKVSAKARTGIGIVEVYVKSTTFRFVGTASCRAIVSRVRKGSRLEVC